MISTQIWQLRDGKLVWNVGKTAHSDNYEMSGLFCDSIIEYGVDPSGKLLLGCSCYYPTLRTIPNDTHATLEVKVNQQQMVTFAQNGNVVTEYPQRFWLDGILHVESHTDAGVLVSRQIFPAADTKCCVQIITLTAERETELMVLQPQNLVLGHTLGTKGIYISRVMHTAAEQISLLPGENYSFAVYILATMPNEEWMAPAPFAERAKRYERVKELCDCSLVLDTGIPELDHMLRFARLRAGESIFETLSGKFHSPGGRTYYAAIWCNDQVEYAGPHLAMTGDRTAIEASLNAYRAYMPYMADNYAPIPSSIIAEGLDIWNGAGDRGDAAMYLYGASLFCLYLGDLEIARELYGAIQWCAEYCCRQRTPEGVIRSDTDELEGRIPTDCHANLCTSSLCYGGLMTAAKLADVLGDGETARLYRQRAEELKRAIETYFGAELHGYSTYRISKGYDTLRAWICLPLCVGIHDRAQGTLDAMLSDYLWTDEGMLTCEISEENRDSTIWDRSTLYGFKAAFIAGAGDRVMEPLLRYCRKRLLCDRVPYAVEAWPEGGKRQLSAESALLVRVITEGLLGIVPESLTAFSFVPWLPEQVPHIYLSDLYIAGHCWQIRVERDFWDVLCDGKSAASGKTDGQRVTITTN